MANYLSGNPNPKCLHAEIIMPKFKLNVIQHHYSEVRKLESFRCTSAESANRAFKKRNKDFIKEVTFYDKEGAVTPIYTAPLI